MNSHNPRFFLERAEIEQIGQNAGTEAKQIPYYTTNHGKHVLTEICVTLG